MVFTMVFAMLILSKNRSSIAAKVPTGASPCSCWRIYREALSGQMWCAAPRPSMHVRKVGRWLSTVEHGKPWENHRKTKGSGCIDWDIYIYRWLMMVNDGINNGITGWWFGTMEFYNFLYILGMSSSQLTFIFFRGVETTNQYII